MFISAVKPEWFRAWLGDTPFGPYKVNTHEQLTIEKTKVAKLLVILERGLLEEAQGKNLSDRDLDGNFHFSVTFLQYAD